MMFSTSLLLAAFFPATIVAVLCPSGYQNLVGSKCVKYVAEKKPFADAREACQADGAELVSIHAREETVAYFKNFGRFGNYGAWIGLDTTSTQWTDGTPLDYNYTIPTQSQCRDPAAAYLVTYDGVYPGAWNCQQAATAFPSICQKQALPEPVSCPTGYQNLVGSKCVKYTANKLPFADAREACQADGGELVSIHAREETIAYFKNFGRFGNYGAWIGLDTTSTQWTDGTPLDYNYTIPTQSQCGDPAAAYLITYDSVYPGAWNCQKAATAFPYICQRQVANGN